MYKKIISFLLIASMISLTAVSNAFATDNVNEITNTNLKSSYYPMTNHEGEAINTPIDENDHLVAENDGIALYLNDSDLTIKILNKTDGYVFTNAVPDTYLSDMSQDWVNFSKSIVALDYIDTQGNVQRSTIFDDGAVPPVISYTDDGFVATLDFNKADIKFDVKVNLTDDGFSLEVPDDSIQILGDNVINKIYILPFFGYSYEDSQPGYIFIPDGSGALIRYGKSGTYSNGYNSAVFGKDLGVDTQVKTDKTSLTTSIPAKQVYMEVFGVAHGNNSDAFAAIIENGQDYCNLDANPAGVTTDFFWACPEFVYNEVYWQKTSDSDGFYAISHDANTVNPKISYHLLSDESADYVGMANVYKNYLIQNGSLTTNVDDKTNIPIKLDAVMSDQEKGIFSTHLKVLTNTSNLKDWVNELSSEGIKNVVLSIEGYENGGLSGHKLNDISFNNKLGSTNDLQDISNELPGGMLVYQNQFAYGYPKQVSKKNVMYSIDGNVIEQYVHKPLYDTIEYITPNYIDSIINQIPETNAATTNYAIDGIGNILCSDYNKKGPKPRIDSEAQVESALLDATNATDNLLLEAPNSYAFKYCNYAYNVPVSDSMYTYESESVPFIQIVLSGYVETFAPYLNTSACSMDDVLKLIDSDTYPSFILMNVYTSEIADTNINDVYSARFGDWKDSIVKIYNYMNSILGPVKGSEIISKNVPQDGVSVTGYSNGKSIVVNYTNATCEYMGTTVAAESAAVVDGGDHN